MFLNFLSKKWWILLIFLIVSTTSFLIYRGTEIENDQFRIESHLCIYAEKSLMKFTRKANKWLILHQENFHLWIKDQDAHEWKTNWYYGNNPFKLKTYCKSDASFFKINK